MILNEVCQLIVDTEHKTAPNVDFGIPSIRTPNVGKGRLILDKDIKFVDEPTFVEWTKRAIPQKDDLIIAREAPVGNVAIVPDIQLCLGQRTVLVRPDDHKVHPSYLCYFLLSPKMQYKMLAGSGGSTVAHLNMKDIRNLELEELPTLPIQQKIASILSTYDDLIENNQKRIKLLEEKARLHYKELIKGEIASKRSKKEFIKNCLEFYIGGGWGKEFYEEGFPLSAFVIRGTDISGSRKGEIQSVPFRYHKESNLASRKMIPGDIVFEVSGGSKDQPVGRSLLMTEKLLNQFEQPVMCASFCKLLRVNDEVSPEFFYLYLLESYENGVIKQYEKHSASNIVNYGFEEFISEQKINIPGENDLNEFTQKVKPIFSLISTLGEQNTKLREARDILLPRLMSGEIEV
jgi:type I restriction enzyme S subunit